MQWNPLGPQVLPQDKAKNRSWKAALDAQFPSLMSSMNRPMAALLLLLSASVLWLLWGLGLSFYQSVREQRLVQAASTLRSCQNQLEVLLGSGKRDWMTDKDVKSVKNKLAQLAHQESKNFYGIRAAAILAERAGWSARKAYESRVAFPSSTGGGKAKRRVPVNFVAKPLIPALDQVFDYRVNSIEDRSYQEAKSWTEFALKHTKNPACRDAFCAQLARICVALGELEAAEGHLKAIRNPLAQAIAGQTQMEIYNLRGDWKSAQAFAKARVKSLKDLEVQQEGLPQAGKEALNRLINLWQLRFEVLEAIEKVNA